MSEPFMPPSPPFKHAAAVGNGTSTLVQPYPRPKSRGQPGVTTRPSADWIAYGKYRSRREKKVHTKRAAELRMKLRQIVRAWHTYVESNRLYRQQCLTDIMEHAVMTGFRRATEKLAAKKLGELRNQSRRTIVDSKRMALEAEAAHKIVAACRSFLDWLHKQPWYGISKEAINPVLTSDVVKANARRAAAERVIGNYLISWAHQRRDDRNEATLNRVRRKVAVHKIETVYITTKKRRLYHYALMKKIHGVFTRKANEAKQRLIDRRRLWYDCWMDVRDYPAKVKAYKERMAALKIQKLYRGVLGRRRALVLRMQRRLKRTTQMIASCRIAFIWSLYKRRKLLRIRQHKTEERQALKFRMRKLKAKGANLSAASLKRFRRVKGPGQYVYRRLQAAKKIQRWIRNVMMARQFAWATKRIMWSNNIVKQFHDAARTIQKLIRLRKLRHHRCATKIQALWKGWHYRMTVIMAKRDELRRIALEEQEARARAILDYKRRKITARYMTIWFVITKMLIRVWRSQWAIHYRKEAEKALTLQMNENAALIQKFWFRKKEKRVARQIVVTMLRKRFAKENKRIGNLVGDLGTTLAVNEPLKVGDKVWARWMGGPKEYPAIVREIVIVDSAGTGKKARKTKDDVVYTVRYQDGTVEYGARKKWLRFIARPRFLPLHGDDEEFLQAPVEEGGKAISKWADTVKDVIAKKTEREVELKAAESVLVNGDTLAEHEGVVDIRIVVGETENRRMEEQQAINFRRGRPRYVKLMPDLRENIRLGRRDFDAVHIWYLKARTGPYITDIRLVRTSWLMEPVQPYMEALRKAGFSVVFRPNKIVGDLFPLPAPTKYRAEFAIVASVGDGKVAPRLGNLQLSSKAPGATGISGNLMSENELFNDGYSPLPEELGMFKLDPGIRMWMKWNVHQELTNVGVPRRRQVGTDVYALAKGTDVDLSFATLPSKKISKIRAKRERIGGSGAGDDSASQAGSETSRTTRTQGTTSVFSPGSTTLFSPGSLVGAQGAATTPVRKLEPIGERPNKHLTSPLNPSFARRGISTVARDEVTNVARITALQTAVQSPAPELTRTASEYAGGAKRIWGTTHVSQLQPQASMPRLVPLSAFDKKNMPRGVEPALEELTPVLRTDRSGGTSARSSRVSFAQSGTPGFGDRITPSSHLRLEPLTRGQSFRAPDEPVRLHDYEQPDYKRVPEFQTSLPDRKSRSLLRDPRLMDLDFFEKEPTGMKVLQRAMSQFVLSAKEKLGDVAYKYLPPAYDQDHEYDSDDEQKSGRPNERAAGDSSAVAKPMHQKALNTMLKSMKSLAHIVNSKLDQIREEEAEIAAANADEDVESEFSDWAVGSDYDSDTGGAPVRKLREKTLFGKLKDGKPVKPGEDEGASESSEDDGTGPSSRKSSARRSKDGSKTGRSAKSFMQSVSKFVSDVSSKIEAIEKRTTARSKASGDTSRTPQSSSRGPTPVSTVRTTRQPTTQRGTERGTARSARTVENVDPEDAELLSDEEGEVPMGSRRAASVSTPATEAPFHDSQSASASGALTVDTSEPVYQQPDAAAWYDDGSDAVNAAGYYDDNGEWQAGYVADDQNNNYGGYYDEEGNWIDTSGGYYDEYGNYVAADGVGDTYEDGVGLGEGGDITDTTVAVDYGTGLKRTEEDVRSPEQRRLDESEATADKMLSKYTFTTVAVEQEKESRKWLEEVEKRLADPLRRPVRMATAPTDRIAAAVQAQMMREEALAQISRKAQYFERMQLKDQEFAFTDEEGLPTVEIVGEFTPTVRVLSLDTDELLQLRDAFRRIKGKEELGVSFAELAKFGKAEFEIEPLADSLAAVVNQIGKVRFAYKLWVEWMVRLCCLPRDRVLRLVYRAFDSSGIGKFGLTDMGRMVKALHPRFGRGPFEKMMEVCIRTCKMNKESSKKTCSIEEFVLLPRASTSLFYPLFLWLDELKTQVMGLDWWEDKYKKIILTDPILLTVGVSNEMVQLKQDGTAVSKPKGDEVARKRAQANGIKVKKTAVKP